MNATSTDTSHELVVMIWIFVRRKLVEVRYMHQEYADDAYFAAYSFHLSNNTYRVAMAMY
jgi:hypothetical protein